MTGVEGVRVSGIGSIDLVVICSLPHCHCSHCAKKDKDHKLFEDESHKS